MKEKISILPNEPGVYRFLDASGTVIYIGKAKNLRKRVQQYFVKPENLTTKTRVLVSKIADVQHTVVESEQDALLLENNLIKQYQPKYNILLKDGKSYPWICIKNEPFPRIFLTRKFVRDGSQYFGPYSSVQHAYHLLDLINTLYKLRTCKLALTPQAIESGKFKPCLNIHIKKCFGPCVGEISQQEYDAQIASIKEILKGNTGTLIREYRKTMQEYAAQMEFEKAQEYKERRLYCVETSREPGSRIAAPVAEETLAPVSENLLFVTKTCPNCRIAKAELEKAHIPYRIVDVEEEPELAKQFGIRQAPTLAVATPAGTALYTNASDIKKFALSAG